MVWPLMLYLSSTANYHFDMAPVLIKIIDQEANKLFEVQTMAVPDSCTVGWIASLASSAGFGGSAASAALCLDPAFPQHPMIQDLASRDLAVLPSWEVLHLAQLLVQFQLVADWLALHLHQLQ
jgi:hypothetical protein